MILVINTSLTGLEFVINDIYKHIDTDKQSLDLPTETEKFLTENSFTWSDLSAIGVIVGPGSFTGIRLGIAYAKGIALGLNIPIVSVNAFELYLCDNPDAFVAIDSGRGDFFVSAKNIAPYVMTIDDIETLQMQYPKTVGHKPYNLKLAVNIVKNKIHDNSVEPVIPMYLRPSYAEK